MAGAEKRKWFKVADADELPEGRVKTVTALNKSLALSHYQGKYGAIDNRCPHQGGPLGEGSIENGLLRCPWHGWDFHPCTGKPPHQLSAGVRLRTCRRVTTTRSPCRHARIRCRNTRRHPEHCRRQYSRASETGNQRRNHHPPHHGTRANERVFQWFSP